MITIGQIQSATVHLRKLTELQIESLRPLVNALVLWERMDFSECDSAQYRLGCRDSARAIVGEGLAAALLEGRLAEGIEEEIVTRIDARDLSQFRKAFQDEIASALKA